MLTAALRQKPGRMRSGKDLCHVTKHAVSDGASVMALTSARALSVSSKYLRRVGSTISLVWVAPQTQPNQSFSKSCLIALLTSLGAAGNATRVERVQRCPP